MGYLLGTLLRLGVVCYRFILRLYERITPTGDERLSPLSDRPYGFTGWGMQSDHANPWGLDGDSPSDLVGAEFRSVERDLRSRILDGRFALTQFGLSGSSSTYSIDSQLQQLRWRHYIVFSSARLACEASRSKSSGDSIHLVEAGVCDGLTAYFARAGAVSTGACVDFCLIDSWGAMRPTDFAPGDKVKENAYSYLRLERTQLNLSDFDSDFRFFQGYVPDVLENPLLPESVAWLHIDLNASETSRQTLERFARRMGAGSICLFDDYGWKSYAQTKRTVDRFFASYRHGTMLSLPTGQGMWINGS